MVQTLEFAFRRRYLLPPTDPRFLNATLAEIAEDYWAHWYADDPKRLKDAENPDFEADLAEMEERDGIPHEPMPGADDPGAWEEEVSDTYGGDGA